MPIQKIIVFSCLAIIAFVNLSNRTGASAVLGHTGSPGDNNISCVNCHGAVAKDQINMISTNMTGGAYTPGDTFEVSVTAEDPGKSVFGFEITCEKPGTKEKIGTWIKNSETRLKRNGGNIGHNGKNTNKQGKKTWTIKWVAPPSGKGDLTFYAVTMCTNGDGTPTNDNHYSSTYSVVEGKVSAVKKMSMPEVTVFPNPVNNFVRVNRPNAVLKIYNFSGELLQSSNSNQMDIRQLPAGVFLLEVKISDQSIYQKIQKL